MKDNKIIAEFMGIKTTNGIVFQDANTKEFHTIKYHTSWDWLMPVVEKCLNIYHIEQMNDDLNFTFYDAMGNMEETYQAVVEFIKDRG